MASKTKHKKSVLRIDMGAGLTEVPIHDHPILRETWDTSTPKSWADGWVQAAFERIPLYKAQSDADTFIADMFVGELPWNDMIGLVVEFITAHPRYNELRQLYRSAFGSDRLHNELVYTDPDMIP